MSQIREILQFLFSLFDGIRVLYTTSFILGSVIALWVFRKVVQYFKHIT